MLKNISGRNRGFTLIEAMIAMVMVVLSVLTMFAMVPFAFNGLQMNAVEVQAVSVAQQFLEDERNAKLESIPMPTATSAPIDAGQSFFNSGNAATIGSAFAVTPNGCSSVQNPGLNTNVYLCSVSVTWTQTGASRSVTVQSYVTK